MIRLAEEDRNPAQKPSSAFAESIPFART